MIHTLDELAAALADLRRSAGMPSYAVIARRIGVLRKEASGVRREPSRVTVYDCFRQGRHRVDQELVLDIVTVLDPDADLPVWRARLARLAAGDHRGLVLPRPPTTTAALRGREEALAAVAGVRTGTIHVTGMTGVGKTAFVATVPSVLGRKPDQVWYVDMHGFDSAAGPADPMATLRDLLSRLGEEPGGLRGLSRDDLTGLLHAELLDRRSIVILDNVRTVSQVAPFLPADPDQDRAIVVVVSRRRLRLGDRTITVELQPLGMDHSLIVLGDLVGVERLYRDLPAAERIARRAGGLPSLLVAAGQEIQSRPEWTMADHDYRSAVESESAGVPMLEGILLPLPAEARELLAQISLQSPHPVDPDIASALLEISAGRAHELLELLVAEHLVEPARRDAPAEAVKAGELEGGSYRLHSQVRIVAQDWANQNVPHSRQQAASRRLLDRLLTRSGTWSRDDAERAAVLGAEETRPAVLSALSSALQPYVEGFGLFDEGAEVHRRAMQAGTVADVARARVRVAEVLWWSGEPGPAFLELSAVISGTSGCSPEVFGAREHLLYGLLLRWSGDLLGADRRLRQAESHALQAEDEVLLVRVRANIAINALDLGELETAEGIVRDLPDPPPPTTDQDTRVIAASAGFYLDLRRGDRHGARGRVEEMAALAPASRRMAARLSLMAAESALLDRDFVVAERRLAAPAVELEVQQRSPFGMDAKLIRGDLLAARGEIAAAVALMGEIRIEAAERGMLLVEIGAANRLGDLMLAGRDLDDDHPERTEGSLDEARFWFRYALAIARRSRFLTEIDRAAAGLAQARSRW